MTDVEQRLTEIDELGATRRMRLVSGPQGPRVVLDGRPVLLLGSNNYLGLADHPRVREAAADAAMRWGVGAGAPRLESGTMTVHRRLEERLAGFHGTEAALLFGSGYLASLGIVSTLGREGTTVFSDAANHAAIADGCRLSRAHTYVYDHGDLDHLAWGLRQAGGRDALIVTDSVFSIDGDVAPLAGLAELARRHGARLVVDESHAIGCLGPEGRGAVAEAGLEDEVDVVVGSLGKALGAYGAYAACDARTARVLVGAARPLVFSTALAPPVVAGALAALELLLERPRRVARLQANAALLRRALAEQGFATGTEHTPIVALAVGEAAAAQRMCDSALERGVFTRAVLPPVVAEGTARLRLSVMASHTTGELRDAARVLAGTARDAGVRPGASPAGVTPMPSAGRAPSPIFDFEAPEPAPTAVPRAA
jgi:glycine C-acetyltransferase/8-amino-7-oxononanoate synthase